MNCYSEAICEWRAAKPRELEITLLPNTRNCSTVVYVFVGISYTYRTLKQKLYAAAPPPAIQARDLHFRSTCDTMKGWQRKLLKINEVALFTGYTKTRCGTMSDVTSTTTIFKNLTINHSYL